MLFFLRLLLGSLVISTPTYLLYLRCLDGINFHTHKDAKIKGHNQVVHVC
ncbi:hypothetical protein Syun_009233 [Stephania yunnanensis]|uniref:Uncharacterized protein n=1 Tax=Stephania yunnanensis TaxID=152371 RepID=A0AAP0PQG3_9MAGN